jgi:D-arabinonate dehydratase
LKIKNVDSTALNLPLRQPSKAGTYKVERRGTIVTKIDTDEDISGEIYLGQHPTEIPHQEKMCEFIHNEIRKTLVGKDPFMIPKHWRKMYELLNSISPYERVDRELFIQSISCVDVCLYDLVAKTLGVPVYKLLGGYREKVPIIQVQYYEKSNDFLEQLEKLRKTVREAKREGFAGIKLKVGAINVNQDSERVRVVREEGGQDFAIACDANHAWDKEKTIQFGKQAEEYSIAYLEEPVDIFDEKRDLKIVRDHINIPIGACQTVFSKIECMEYVSNGCVDMINPDIIRVGGITEWVNIAKYADYYNVRMTAHACIETTIPLFGSVHNSTWVTQQTPWRDPFWSGGELIKDKPKLKNGYLKLNDEPGIGYSINEKAIEKYSI